MKFLKTCKNVLENKKLQKIRIKVDPMWAEKLGMYNSPNFEGYILEETPLNECSEVKVFVVNVPPGYDPVQTIKTDNIEQIDSPEPENVTPANYSKLTLLKKGILEKMIELGKKKDDPDVLQVLNSKDLGFIETFLRQMKFTDEDLLNLYRKCFKKC